MYTFLKINLYKFEIGFYKFVIGSYDIKLLFVRERQLKNDF